MRLQITTHRSAETEAEDLVLDKVARGTTLLEEESLSEAHGVAAVDGEAAVDEHEDALVHARLEVEHC